jgi:methionine aminotransferase
MTVAVSSRAGEVPVTDKLSKYESSIFAEMGALSLKHQAVNLAQGFPDYQKNDQILIDAARFTEQGFNQYAPMNGVLALREAISDYKFTTCGRRYDPATEIVVTTGALQALHSALASIITTGDEVIIFDPSFDCYRPIVELNGGIPITITQEAPSFDFNWEEISKRINKKTKAIILNSPNNPTGKLLTYEDVAALERITADSGIIIISDEVYEHAVFNGNKHLSISQFESLASRSLVISSLGKIFHVTGWRVGYCLGPKQLIQSFLKIHQFTVFSGNSAALQMAIANQLNNMEYYKEINSAYDTQRKLFLELVSKTAFKPLPIDGSFFCLLDYSAISDKTENEMARWLAIEHGVSTIPLSAFYVDKREQHLLRACFVKKEETLRKAIAGLEKAFRG